MPMLVAAIFCSQREFDRTYRSIIRADCYKGRELFYIAGINIDISPTEGNTCLPMINFIPWAAAHLRADGSHTVFEQAQLVDMLNNTSSKNNDQINLETACLDDRINMLFSSPEDPRQLSKMAGYLDASLGLNASTGQLSESLK